jgi:hypothetical protein
VGQDQRSTIGAHGPDALAGKILNSELCSAFTIVGLVASGLLRINFYLFLPSALLLPMLSRDILKNGLSDNFTKGI